LPTVLDDKGNAIQLGPVLGRGGEGVVRELRSDPSLVAKLYHRPLEGVRAEKLAAMARSSTPEILKFAAWPISTLHTNNQTVGLLMRRISSGEKPIHELYTPKTRLREFPPANWRFLIHVAANVARGFAVLHRAGHVIGDVNHGNILVSSSGTTAFIDCDSFQVSANGRVYICEVGVPTYTPPELQNRPFKSFQRNQNHDAFGLAVLIFHLLFMGRHPFAGRFLGRGEMPIERAISECRFPFGHLAQQVQMSPPPNSLTLSQIPAPLADAFERAFSAHASKGAPRPPALEWLELLQRAQTDLVHCNVHQAHLYFSKVSNCPWCSIEARGIILFLEVGAQSASGSNVEELWKRLAALPSLTVLPAFPTATNRGLSAVATPVHRARGRSRRIRMASGIGLIVVVVVMLSILKLDGYLSTSLFVGSILVAYLLPRELQKERASLASTLREYKAKYSQMQNKYSAECGERPFTSILDDLGRLRNEHNGLALQRQRKLQELEQNKYRLQLTQFLDKFTLSDARIPSIGIGRKQMLSSYGVDTAADVTELNLSQVPGIGPKFAERIMSWRRSIELRFQFDPHKAIDRFEIDKIDRDIKSRRMEIENQIGKRVNDAAAAHGVIAARRKAYVEQALVTLKSLIQTEASYRAS